MLLYCTMISFGFVCHYQGVSPFSKQGWGCLENILRPCEYIIFHKISAASVNISCFQNIFNVQYIFRIPLHNDSFGVFWNDIMFYEYFIHRNRIMPKICLILSRSNLDILCVGFMVLEFVC